MKITKLRLDDLYRVYSVSEMIIKGQQKIFFASEEIGYPCYAYTGPDFKTRETVWDDGGGCMSMIPVPNTDNQFLTIRDFYLKETPSHSRLVLATNDDANEWEFETVFEIEYLHRFDIFEYNGVNHVILTIIADKKDHKEDWTRPGSVYAGQFVDGKLVNVKKIASNYYRNHGYVREYENGKPVSYISSDQGVFRFESPESSELDWNIVKVFDGMVSEVAFCDINNDGNLEMMTIEPFHGQTINIYKKVNNKYELDYTYPNKIDFAHTIQGVKLRGVNSFVAGVRRCDCELFVIQYNDNKYQVTIIEKGVGPANLKVVNEIDRDLIISANHTENETAIYIVE